MSHVTGRGPRKLTDDQRIEVRGSLGEVHAIIDNALYRFRHRDDAHMKVAFEYAEDAYARLGSLLAVWAGDAPPEAPTGSDVAPDDPRAPYTVTVKSPSLKTADQVRRLRIAVRNNLKLDISKEANPSLWTIALPGSTQDFQQRRMVDSLTSKKWRGWVIGSWTGDPPLGE